MNLDTVNLGPISSPGTTQALRYVSSQGEIEGRTGNQGHGETSSTEETGKRETGTDCNGENQGTAAQGQREINTNISLWSS